jgi:hypothetical protein
VYKMEDLQNVMRVIDKNSDKLPEGDYLELCNLLRNVFRNEERKVVNTIFNYENFDLYVPGQHPRVTDYFYDNYFTTSINHDRTFLRSQIAYLEGELEYSRPQQRISKYVKGDALIHYCSMNDINLDTCNEESLKQYKINNGTYIDDRTFKKYIHTICKGYMHIDNIYRVMYSNLILDRIERLSACLDDLDDV